ncbi:unnamed protein product [Dracunculus medinensis]|uniref:Density-regulated protein n=1 Tax=Dracunculus medinensis TaxID=318479 RepID=A0A0N4UPQ4_DRAME|nr:unnamed protein product [Dracunculus medinensis]
MSENGGEIVSGNATVSYPIHVKYCGACTLPLEYCEYSGMVDKCRKWLEDYLPNEFDKLCAGNEETAESEKKHQKRGGKGLKSTEKMESDKSKKKVLPKVTLQKSSRGKNKSVTVVKGLALFGVDLKAAAKLFAAKFACGSSVTAPDEIVVQGDVKDELLEVITGKWRQIDEGSIEDLGDHKR